MPGILIPPNPKLVLVPDILIDENGRFKYIMCVVTDPDKPEDKKTIIRGTARAEIQGDMYDDVDSMLEDQGLTCQCIGGGRIKHDPTAKFILVFGKSQGYGRANHLLAVDMLRKKYPLYAITWSND